MPLLPSSVSSPNHSEPLALKTSQLHPYQMHPTTLFLVVRFRLIFYTAFKVHRQFIDSGDILSLSWAL